MKLGDIVFGAVIGALAAFFIISTLLAYSWKSAIVDHQCAYYHHKTGEFTWLLEEE